jgi:hypothetical protein
MSEYKTVGDYYKMYCSGSPFSDEELCDAIRKTHRLLNDLSSLGEKFAFSKNEICRVYDSLSDYLFSRQMDKRSNK